MGQKLWGVRKDRSVRESGKTEVLRSRGRQKC